MAGIAERTLALKIIGDVSDLKKTQRSLGSFTKGVLSWGKALSGALVIGGIEKVVGGLGDAFKGFKSGQRVSAQLRKTWKNLGLEGRKYGRTLDAVTDSTLRLGTSDDEAVAVFTRSLQRTRDSEKSLKELRIAQDLVANGSAPNLAAAERLIQQAAKGSARVVDRFGLSARTAAGRVNEMGRQVRGAAREKAKLDPFGVLFNRIAEDAETIVGAFAKGDFKGVVKGLQGLGSTIDTALFGKMDKKTGERTGGLVSKFGSWGGKLAEGIATEFGKVKWDKAIGDALNTAAGAVAEAARNGTLGNLAILGGALAGAIFAVDLFFTAAKTMFSPSAWLAGLGGILKAVGAVLGFSMRAGMFVASRFIDAAALVVGTLARDKVLLGAARGLGGSIGGSVLAGVIAGLTGAVAVGAVADALTKLFTNAEMDWTKRGERPLPDSPFKWPWQEGGFFFPKHARGTRSAHRGIALVGEEGPELVGLSGGERIWDARRSAAAMSGGGVTNNNFYIQPGVGDPVAIGREIDRILAQYYRRSGGVRAYS